MSDMRSLPIGDHDLPEYVISPELLEATNYGRNPIINSYDKIRVQCDKCKNICIVDPERQGRIIDRKWLCDVCISHLHEREYCDQRCFSRKDYIHTIYQDPELNYDETKEYYYACGIPNHKNCTRKLPIIDIREMDSRLEFGLPLRYKQIRDFR